MIKAMLDRMANDLVRLYGMRRADLRIVGRPSLIRALHKAHDLPNIPVLMSTALPEHVKGNQHTSDLLMIHQRDAWMYGDTIRRRKLRRVARGIR